MPNPYMFSLRRAWSLPCRYISYSSRLLTKDDKIVKPWFVVEAQKAIENEPKFSDSKDFPALPSDPPKPLADIVGFAVKDMGLKDVQVLDRRGDDLITSALGQSIIVVGTGSSTKHLGSAGMLLTSWLKKEYKIFAGREGILSTNKVKVHNRRQKKKQQRQRLTNEDNSSLSRVGPWIAVDTKLDNIFVHIMTAERRKEIDLEHLDEIEAGAEIFESEIEELNTEYNDPNPTAVTGNFGTKTTKRQYSTVSSTPSTREELALENLLAETKTDITEASDEIKSFVDNFPRLPTREDWKRRLKFFSIAAIQSPVFPLKRVLQEAEAQQSAGFVLDDEDIETVLSSICYHSQSYFAQLAQTDETTALWQELCDYKAHLLLDFYNLALRPTGKTLLGNPRYLVLLYRTFVGLSASSTTPSAVLIDPTPDNVSVDAFFDFRRLHSLRYLLQATEEIRNIQTCSMVLASLANRELFDAFWAYVDVASLSGGDKEFVEQLVELAVSLIVKGGDLEQINYAIQTFLPQSIAMRNVRLTPTLARAIESGLDVVDAEKTGTFKSVRAVLADYRASAPQLN